MLIALLGTAADGRAEDGLDSALAPSNAVMPTVDTNCDDDCDFEPSFWQDPALSADPDQFVGPPNPDPNQPHGPDSTYPGDYPPFELIYPVECGPAGPAF
jgi:hypothetical protein